jgi:regulator of RNase E activity RraA
MSLRAQILGAAGVIVDGRVRDLQEHRDLGFPACYAFIIPTQATPNTPSSPLSQQ